MLKTAENSTIVFDSTPKHFTKTTFNPTGEVKTNKGLSEETKKALREGTINVQDLKTSLEREIITNIMVGTGFNQSYAATLYGTSRSTFLKLLNKHFQGNYTKTVLKEVYGE